MSRLRLQRPIAGLPGTYALLLRCRRPARVVVGRLAVLRARAGFYLYVGSALGPGGVGARVRHHARRAARPRWHIDELRARTRLVEVWHAHDARRREHAWATIAARLPGASVPLAGFGSSDCRCAAHLFFFETRPSVAAFRRRLRRAFPVHAPVRVAPVRRPAPSSAA